MWLKLCNTYEENIASNKVFLMRKLYNLCMKESANVASHINEFDSLFAQICAHQLNIDDEMKAIHLLCSLPPSWGTFCTVVSNSTPNGTLFYNDISGALLVEETRRETMGSLHHGKAHYVQKAGKQRRGCSRPRDSDKDAKDGKKDNALRAMSKSRRKQDIQCHFCDKYGHIKRDCYAWQ